MGGIAVLPSAANDEIVHYAVFSFGYIPQKSLEQNTGISSTLSKLHKSLDIVIFLKLGMIIANI